MMVSGVFASAAAFGRQHRRNKREFNALPLADRIAEVKEALHKHNSIKPSEYRSFLVAPPGGESQRIQAWRDQRSRMEQTLRELEAERSA